MQALWACVLLAATFAADSVPTAREMGLPSASPWVIPNPGAAKGTVRESAIPSAVYGRDRRVWIYTPPGFDRGRAIPYHLLIAFDGAEYLDVIPIPTILDNLLAARKIAPTVAILIDNGRGADRLGELANRAAFANFMGTEVAPWARRNWNVAHDPRRTIVTGSSAGGLAAAYVALKRPDLFGNVLAQSGAFWRGNEGSNEPPFEWLTAQYQAAPKLPIVFWMDTGGRETTRVLGGAGPVPLEANRRLRDVLIAKGYTVGYAEIPNAAHEPGHWRNHIAEGLLWLASKMP